MPSILLFLHSEQKGRIVVERMVDGSNAALGGLQVGDRIRGTTARSKVCAQLINLLMQQQRKRSGC